MTVPQASLNPKPIEDLMTLMLKLLLLKTGMRDKISLKPINDLALSSKCALEAFGKVFEDMLYITINGPANTIATRAKIPCIIKLPDKTVGYYFVYDEIVFCHLCLPFVRTCMIKAPMTQVKFFPWMKNLEKLCVNGTWNLPRLPPNVKYLRVNCVNIDALFKLFHTFHSVNYLELIDTPLDNLASVPHQFHQFVNVVIHTTIGPIHMRGVPSNELGIVRNFMRRFSNLTALELKITQHPNNMMIGSLSPLEVKWMTYDHFSLYRRTFEATEFNAPIKLYITNWLTTTWEDYEDVKNTFEAAGYQCTEAVFMHQLLLPDKEFYHTMIVTITN